MVYASIYKELAKRIAELPDVSGCSKADRHELLMTKSDILDQQVLLVSAVINRHNVFIEKILMAAPWGKRRV